MPQLDFFWWGVKFFLCWSFFMISFIYYTKVKFLVSFSNFFNSCVAFSVKSFFWLW